MQAQRDDAAFPIELTVDSSGGVPGLTVTVAVRDVDTVDGYLDFDDLTFKAAGWGTKFAALADLTGGLYRLAGGLPLGTLVNLPASTDALSLEYSVTGTHIAVTQEILVLVQGLYSAAETLRKQLLNRHEINFATQELIAYDDDGLTILQKWNLATDGAELVAAVVGSATKRSAPLL